MGVQAQVQPSAPRGNRRRGARVCRHQPLRRVRMVRIGVRLLGFAYGSTTTASGTSVTSSGTAVVASVNVHTAAISASTASGIVVSVAGASSLVASQLSLVGAWPVTAAGWSVAAGPNVSCAEKRSVRAAKRNARVAGNGPIAANSSRGVGARSLDASARVSLVAGIVQPAAADPIDVRKLHHDASGCLQTVAVCNALHTDEHRGLPFWDRALSPGRRAHLDGHSSLPDGDRLQAICRCL
jgi:hypothetical protein